MIRLLHFAAISCALLLVLCLPAVAGNNSAPLPVLVSIAPQKFLLDCIAGDAVSVTVLVKPGSDPHAYEPSPAQVRAASASQIWFTIGVPFEDVWLPRIMDNAPHLRTVSLISDIQRLTTKNEERDHHNHVREAEHAHQAAASHGHEHTHTHDGEDPHVWLSPLLIRQMLPVITQTLCRELPDRTAGFQTKAKNLDGTLETLHAELSRSFQPFPTERRVFLTFHPSWRYFALHYDLTELSIEVDGKEPSPKQLQEIMDMAKAHGITTVFVEPQFPKNAARAIAEALGATIVEADPLAEDLIQLYTGMGEKLVQSFAR
jgi:zinc transport system substrate-binding protein